MRHDAKKGAQLKRMRLWKPPHTGMSHDADVSFCLFCLMSWFLSWRSWCAAALRHELSSLARTLGSWVRIPLKSWMSVFAFILCLCCSVAALRRANHSSKESYRLCKKDYKSEVEARAQQRAVEPLTNEWKMNTIKCVYCRICSLKTSCHVLATWWEEMSFCPFIENPSGMQNFIQRNPTGNVHEPHRRIASLPETLSLRSTKTIRVFITLVLTF
jgi:hypothetical protein